MVIVVNDLVTEKALLNYINQRKDVCQVYDDCTSVRDAFIKDAVDNNLKRIFDMHYIEDGDIPEEKINQIKDDAKVFVEFSRRYSYLTSSQEVKDAIEKHMGQDFLYDEMENCR